MDIMIDFESLGVSEDSVILSMGLTVFDKDVIYTKYYEEYDMRFQVADGCTVNPDTVAWWHRTNRKEFDRLILSGKLYPWKSIDFLVSRLRQDYKIQSIWSRGSIDFKWLNRNLENPFPYWSSRDCRTLDMFVKMEGSNDHNALNDAVRQTEQVQRVMQWQCNVQSVEAWSTSRLRDAESVIIDPLKSVNIVPA